MSLYQPSFCLPRNQAIDATDSVDMTFSWRLNGNNPLVAYNIQIFDNDTNNLVYELISTANERKIQEKINEISNWISIQNEKMDKAEEAEELYNASVIRTNFKNKLRDAMTKEKKKVEYMEEVLLKKNKGETLEQTEISKYFEYWGNILTDLNSLIGDEEHPIENTGAYVLNTIEDWLNIDPARKDGVEYADEDKEIINRTAYEKVKEQYESFKTYYESTKKAISGASDTTFISSSTFYEARKAAYLIYSEYSDEIYFGKDLYESVNSVWTKVNFDKLREDILFYRDEWTTQLNQEVYALAHLTGGVTKQSAALYSTSTASEANKIMTVEKGVEVAVLTKTPTPPSGWYYVIVEGTFGYMQSSMITEYNLKVGKYYLEKPVYPTNYEGEANVVSHQLPINILQNGKSYKWKVKLYWSSSGRYNQDDQIDGELVSVENYFDTRKKPSIGLENIEQLFEIPSNYVTVKMQATTRYTDKTTGEEKIVTLNKGDSVLFLHRLEDDVNSALVEYVTEDNVTIELQIPVSWLNGTGLYTTSKNYVLPSKRATFIGHYEQEQYVSISYFRWVLYKLQNDSEKITEVVKDTGMIPSVDLKFYYDGFLNGEKYAIQLFVQTLDNVEVETELIKFKVSYIDIAIENMVNAQNSPIEHGIIVEWSNLRLIEGYVEGKSSYVKDIPTTNKTSLTLEKGSTLTFDKDKGVPLSIDFDANQILCTRFDEDRPMSAQVFYTASGLDDNGDVVSKTLEMVPDRNTQNTGVVTLRYTVKTAKLSDVYSQKIIASPLYWYIIIMRSNGFTVFTKYAQGLFPALDQYPNRNKFTGSNGVYPEALTYLEEPSDRVEYNYQTIIDREGNEK